MLIRGPKSFIFSRFVKSKVLILDFRGFVINSLISPVFCDLRLPGINRLTKGSSSFLIFPFFERKEERIRYSKPNGVEQSCSLKASVGCGCKIAASLI